MFAKTIFEAETISAGGSSESVALDLVKYAQEGFFSVQISLTGNGVAKLEYELSNDGISFITQTAEADVIVSGFTATSGPGLDGKDIISFEPEVAKEMIIKCTETGGADSVVITAIVIVH